MIEDYKAEEEKFSQQTATKAASRFTVAEIIPSKTQKNSPSSTLVSGFGAAPGNLHGKTLSGATTEAMGESDDDNEGLGGNADDSDEDEEDIDIKGADLIVSTSIILSRLRELSVPKTAISLLQEV